MVQTSEHGFDHDGLLKIDILYRLPWYLLSDALMRPRPVEVFLVLPDKTTKVLVIEHDHVVQQLPPGAAHKAFSDGVHVRGSYCLETTWEKRGIPIAVSAIGSGGEPNRIKQFDEDGTVPTGIANPRFLKVVSTLGGDDQRKGRRRD